MATSKDNTGYQSFVKTVDGERVERAVYSTADAVQARFDGFFPEDAPKSEKRATGSSSSSSSSSSGSSSN